MNHKMALYEDLIGRKAGVCVLPTMLTNRELSVSFHLYGECGLMASIFFNHRPSYLPQNIHFVAWCETSVS